MNELQQVRRLIERGIADGLHAGAQVHASIRGRTVAELALGDARPASESSGDGAAAMTRDSVLLWMSSCKPITSIAIAQQCERGQLDLDAPVARYLPAFADGGKQDITVRHVLTHTGGFRAADFTFPDDDWDTIIARICAAPREPDWTPGEKAGYHIHTGWFILGELVQRAADQPLPDYLRRHIFEPAGMTDSWIGMPTDVMRTYGDRISVMLNTARRPPEPTDDHREGWITRCRPSGNGYGPARDLARFYELLLAGGGPLMRPETIGQWTGRVRRGLFDHTFHATIDWGLGFLLDTRQPDGRAHPYGYGAHASGRTFGHSGAQSSAAFADPAHQLAAAVLFNGSPGERKHQQRIHAVLTALYEDLGLAGDR